MEPIADVANDSGMQHMPAMPGTMGNNVTGRFRPVNVRNTRASSCVANASTIPLDVKKGKTMSNAFTNSAAQIADMSVSYASVSEAETSIKKLAKTIETIDNAIGLKRGEKASLIIASIAPMKVIMDANTDDDVTAASQGIGVGIVAGTVSMVRQVGSIASYAKSGYDGTSKFNSLTEAKCDAYLARVEAWYGFETAGTPSAPTLRSLFTDLLEHDGDVRLSAIQTVREIFGNVTKIYTIATGKCVHPDAPAPAPAPDDDDDKGDTWQGMLGRALDAARSQGATDTEVMAIVRAFNTEA
jgi:hypothetical protein